MSVLARLKSRRHLYADHAPAGGATVGGRAYAGGQFTPHADGTPHDFGKDGRCKGCHASLFERRKDKEIRRDFKTDASRPRKFSKDKARRLWYAMSRSQRFAKRQAESASAAQPATTRAQYERVLRRFLYAQSE